MISLDQDILEKFKNPEHQAGVLVLVSRGEARIIDTDKAPIPLSRLLRIISPMARDLFWVTERKTTIRG